MFIIYIFISVICFTIGLFVYKTWKNPISIYLSIWVLCISFHQSGLIYYYDLKLTTWFVIIMAEVAYVLGCVFGVIFSNSRIQKKSRSIINLESTRKILKTYIIILSVIASLSIVTKLFYIVRTYGFNLFSNILQIYKDSIYERMNYTDVFNTEGVIFIAIAFSSVYLYRYKYEHIIVLPLLLLVVSQLSSGSRGSLISGILLFSSQFILKNKKKRSISITTLGKKPKKSLMILTGILCVIVFLITFSRSGEDITLPYANDLISDNNIVYSIVFYFSVPIAVLNEYLKNPIHSHWGAATFRIFYQVLDKFGFVNYDVNFIGEYLFYTPGPSNVLTYIGELIYDFNYGAIFVVFLLGLLFSLSFCNMHKNESVFADIVTAACFSLVSLSFFAWFLRLSIFWYVLLIGGILAYIIDHRKRVD